MMTLVPLLPKIFTSFCVLACLFYGIAYALDSLGWNQMDTPTPLRWASGTFLLAFALSALGAVCSLAACLLALIWSL